MAEHIASRKTYFLVFAALISLTALTTAAAFVDFDKLLGLKGFPLNTLVALAIAAVKASLVAFFFMHLKWSSHLTRFVGVAALFWLAILIVLSLNDYFTRNRPPGPTGWETPSTLLLHR